MNQEVTDQVVLSVMAKYAERSATGLKKYGTTLDREDLTIYDWINHAQEEAMDFTLYLERIRKEIQLIEIKGFSNGYREAIKNERGCKCSGIEAEHKCHCFNKQKLNKDEQKEKLIELMNMDSYEPKECACYGSNSMHECNCK